jgi:hypothetical protein
VDATALESLSILDGMLALIRNAELPQIDGWVQKCIGAHEAGRLTDEHLEDIAAAAQARRDRHRLVSEQRGRRVVGRAVVSVLRGIEATAGKLLAAGDPAPARSRPKVQVAPEVAQARAKRRERRHYISITLPMPAQIAKLFGVAGRAVLARISLAHRGQGFCELSVQALATAAEVSERLVQYTVRLARRLGLIAVETRHKATNRITIISQAWLEWMGGLRIAEKQENVPEGLAASEQVPEITHYTSFSSLPLKGAKIRNVDAPLVEAAPQEPAQARDPDPAPQVVGGVSRPSAALPGLRGDVPEPEQQEPNRLMVALANLRASMGLKPRGLSDERRSARDWSPCHD